LLTICQSLPGPTSTQLLTAISMYATASFMGGFLAFIIFSLPAFIAMFTAVIFLQEFTN
jgi:chromate transporter